MFANFFSFISNSLTIAILIGYLFALWAALVAWTWFDISSRTNNSLLRLGAILIVATGAILGFAVYLLLRPNFTKEEAKMRDIEDAILASQSGVFACQECGFFVREDFEHCPNCGLKLQNSCRNCNRKMNMTWGVCPFCGTKREAPVEIVETPALEVIKEEPAVAEPVIANNPAKVILSWVGGFLNKINAKTKRRSKAETTAGSKVTKLKKKAKRAKS